jgi:hypothetical protein
MVNQVVCPSLPAAGCYASRSPFPRASAQDAFFESPDRWIVLDRRGGFSRAASPQPERVSTDEGLAESQEPVIGSGSPEAAEAVAPPAPAAEHNADPPKIKLVSVSAVDIVPTEGVEA